MRSRSHALQITIVKKSLTKPECPAEKELSDIRRLAGADASPRTGKLSKAPAPGLSSPASGSSHAGPQGIAIQRKLLSRALRARRGGCPSEILWAWKAGSSLAE